MWRLCMTGLVTCACAYGLVGCSKEAPQGKQVPDGSKYLLKEKPEGAKGVIELRKEKNDEKEVVVIGRIGGRADVWNEGMAVFTIADMSLKSCPPEEGCPTPWDCCCEIDLDKKRAVIELVDANGDIIEYRAKELLKLKELDTVVVSGIAKRGKKGALTIVAKGLYVQR